MNIEVIRRMESRTSSGIFSLAAGLAIFAACLSSQKTQATLLVAPNYAANSQLADSAESTFNSPIRQQTVYGASEFPPYPIVISEIQYRPDVYQGGRVTNSTISNIQINLSTTTNRADHLSSTFAQNTGSDNTVVFSGSLSLSTSFTALSNGIYAFDENIPLQTPFTYDPSKGNLLIEVRNISGSTTTIYDNSTSSTTDTVSRVYAPGAPSATSASGADTAGGAIQITYTVAPLPPVVRSQPMSQTVSAGGPATFQVSATGAPPLSYQWFFNSTNDPIAGATNNSLTLTDLQTSQSGTYFVDVSDSFGSTLSSNAVLTVMAVPLITSQPVSQLVQQGTAATLSVAATSGAPLAYQWFFNDTNLIVGATNGSLTLTNAQFDETGLYSVQITNVYGSVVSSDAVLTVADLLVAPNYAANSQLADSAEAIFNSPNRQQTVYGASEFPPYPIVISEIQYRPDSSQGGPVPKANISSIQINLSTTTSRAGGLSTTFAQNTGPDDTVVFSGSLSLSTSFTTLSNGTYVFDESIPLQTPFTYDPSKGNLLIDVRNFSGSTATIYDNSTASTTDTVSRVYASGNPNATSATSYDTGGAVIRIVSTPGPVAPVVTGQPTDEAVTNGGAATFQVSATGTSPLSYQWYFAPAGNGQAGAYAGQTNNTLNITNASQNDLGNYFVVISDSGGSVTSSVVSLTFLYPPGIVQNPVGFTGSLGSVNTLSVLASGTPPFSYQWLLNGTNIIGATGSSYVIAGLTLATAGSYSVEVANPYGSTNSLSAVVEVLPTLVSPFTGAVELWGQTAMLNVGAVGSGALSYQWYFNGQAIAGATNSSYDFSSIQFTNAGLYNVVVSSQYGSVTNAAYYVVVNPANTSIGMYAGVTIEGTVGNNYTIQSTTNLGNPNSWMTLTNITLTSPIQIWSDYSTDIRNPNIPQKFYQVLPGQ